MPESISIFGLGYVGSVTAACFAGKGFQVIGIDKNPQKVESLNAGRSPIVEPALDDLIRKGHCSGLLRATTNAEEAVANTNISFISVGTPSQHSGKLNLSYVNDVCTEIGRALRFKGGHHHVVMRSTVLPGTTETIVCSALEKASGKRCGEELSVSFNPEFLREGSAIEDFFHPEITVLGGQAEGLKILRELYDWVPGRVFETTTRNAEMVKYVCNAFHALKIAFANEVGTFCNELAVSHDVVTNIYTADTRLNISPLYLRPGSAFGGSCLPKDLKALAYCAKEHDLTLPLLESILPSNVQHIERAVEAVLQTGKRKVGVIGLSFKPGTDDLRESPMVYLVKRLLGEGCQVEIWDPHVSMGQLIGSNRQFITDNIPHIGSLLCDELHSVIQKAEVLVIGSKGLIESTVSSNPGQIVIDLAALAAPQTRTELSAAAPAR